MIDNPALATLLASATDFSTVVEIYHQDAVPSAGGFDPGDALDCYAAIDGVYFMGVTYKRLIKKIGSINRTIGSETNSANVEFSNVTREISQFEFAHGFEGLIMVVRLISRNGSIALSDSMILFAGRCDKPASGNKDSLSVTAKWILGGAEVQIPRRTYIKEDLEGRVESDPEFEGFIFMPQEGVSSYQARVKRGGILGFFGMKKWVTKTLQWSSHSDIDATKAVPEVFGRGQLLGTHIAYADTGGFVLLRDSFCEGEIADFTNVRSLDPNLPLSGVDYLEILGKTGAANADAGGVQPGNYSRTACIRGKASNSLVDVNDSAPDIAAVVKGRLMTVPDTKGGTFSVPDTWTDNPAAHARFIITSPDYFNLDESWVDDELAVECFDFNNETIIERSQNDLLFAQQG